MNEGLHNSLEKTEWAGPWPGLSWLGRAKDGAQAIGTGPCHSLQAVVGWAGLGCSRAALTCPFLNLVLSWRSALLWVSRGHFSSMDHFPHLKNSVVWTEMWCTLWHPVPAQSPGLQGGCTSAASVRDGYLHVPAHANPQEMPFWPSSSVLHLKINHQRKNTSSKNFLIYCKFSFHLCCNSSVLHINKYTFVKKTNFQCLICHKAFKKS